MYSQAPTIHGPPGPTGKQEQDHYVVNHQAYMGRRAPIGSRRKTTMYSQAQYLHGLPGPTGKQEQDHHV